MHNVNVVATLRWLCKHHRETRVRGTPNVKSPRRIKHENRRTRTGQHLLAASIAACLCLPATAEDARSIGTNGTAGTQGFHPYASLGYGYDSNIYRIDDAAPSIGERSDQYAMLQAGFDFNHEPGLQKFQLNAEIGHTFFNEHDDLDYTGGRALARWQWETTEGATGDLGYRFKRSLRDFANQDRLDKVKDIRSEHTLFASGNLDVAEHWRVGMRGALADIGYSETEALDLQRTTLGVRADYLSGAGNRVGLDAEYVLGRYDSNEGADYDEYTVGPALDWQLTDRTSVSAIVGYTVRDNDSPLREDYDGITGKLEVDVAGNGGPALTATVYRDISNIGDEVAEYAVVNGVSVEPRWQLSSAVELRLEARYENRDFQVPDDILIPDARDDDVYGGGAFVDWNVRPNVTVSLGVDTEQRSSSREFRDYDFVRAELQVTARF